MKPLIPSATLTQKQESKSASADSCSIASPVDTEHEIRESLENLESMSVWSDCVFNHLQMAFILH
jgi:hypothetical protein